MAAEKRSKALAQGAMIFDPCAMAPSKKTTKKIDSTTAKKPSTTAKKAGATPEEASATAKKPSATARKPEAAKATVAAAQADDGELPLVTLGELQPRVGPPNAKLAVALFANVSDEERVARGVRVDSALILREGPALVAAALAGWKATPEAKRRSLLRADVPAFAALCVDSMVTLEKMKESFDRAAQASSASKADRRRLLKQAMSDGIALRDGAYDDLRHVAGSNKAQIEALDEAIGTADSADNLAAGLKQLAKRMRKLLKSSGDEGSVLLAALSLDEDRAKELDDAAAAVLAADKAAQATTPEHRTTQRQLDLQDGTALVLLDLLVRVFHSAHGRDASVIALHPRLLAFAIGPRGASPPKPAAPATPKT